MSPLVALLGRAGRRPTWPLLGAKQTPPSCKECLRPAAVNVRWCGCPRRLARPQAARPSRRRVLHLDYASPMTDVFPRIRTVATGERSKALQGVVPVSWHGTTSSTGETTLATDY
jgi:hypothetical protein